MMELVEGIKRLIKNFVKRLIYRNQVIDKPCPVCGGTLYGEIYPNDPYYDSTLYCMSCDAFSDGIVFHTDVPPEEWEKNKNKGGATDESN